jgi:two-component system, NtrC family, sensor kinase
VTSSSKRKSSRRSGPAGRTSEPNWGDEQTGPVRTRASASERELEATIASLREQLIQTQRLAGLGRLVASVAHDLNNPTTAILAYTEYLERQGRSSASSPEKSLELERLSRITESAERIRDLCRALISYAKPATLSETLDVADLLERALRFCEHELAEGEIQVTSELGRQQRVRGIATNLIQVFVNLFSNAAHSMLERPGHLHVKSELSESGDIVVIEVADEGIGIPLDEQSRIFDAFYTTKADGVGTGLGLSIVKEIVEAHGGTISVESDVGKGSVFRVELPAEPAMSRPIRKRPS